MKNIDDILNALTAELLNTGKASFSNNGLNVETTYNDGCFNFKVSYESPKKDELLEKFESYIDSLNEDFFLEVVESFVPGGLKKIQDKLDSKNPVLVKEGINQFMYQLKFKAAEKIDLITKDIDAVNMELLNNIKTLAAQTPEDLKMNLGRVEKELSELNDIRESYKHVVNKEF